MAKGIALTVGLNSVDPEHYAGWAGELNACEYDANDLAAIAKSQEFEVDTLLTKAATRDAVRAKILDAAEKLVSGDIFMLSYSGHGGQVADVTGEERDAADETWCLYDGELIDDELYELWTKFKSAVRILVFSDSCHSGTVTRMARAMATSELPSNFFEFLTGGGRPAWRFMPLDVANRVYRAHKSFYDNLQKSLKPKDFLEKINVTVRLISGCQDNQLSSDGTFNGLFTAKLLQVWDNGSFEGNYIDFHELIVGLMPPYQTPNHFVIGSYDEVFEKQKPFTI